MIHSLLFFPDKKYTEQPQDYGLTPEEVSIPTPDGQTLTGWFLPAHESKGTILFSHGNAGNISGRLFKAAGWVTRGYSVLLWDYRGYGKSSGVIQSDRELAEDSRLVMEWLLHEKKIPASAVLLYGESIGTYPSIRLAAEYKVAGLILESPFPSFKHLAIVHYRWIPSLMSETLLKDFAFSSEEHLSKIQAPLWVWHGTADEVCPFSLSQQLFEKAPQPKEFCPVPGGMHNDLPVLLANLFWDKPLEFLKQNDQ